MSDDTKEDTPIENIPLTQEEMDEYSKIVKMNPQEMDERELRIFMKIIFSTLTMQGNQFSANDEALDERLDTIEDNFNGHRIRIKQDFKQIATQNNQIASLKEEIKALKTRFNKFKKKD